MQTQRTMKLSNGPRRVEPACARWYQRRAWETEGPAPGQHNSACRPAQRGAAVLPLPLRPSQTMQPLLSSPPYTCHLVQQHPRPGPQMAWPPSDPSCASPPADPSPASEPAAPATAASSAPAPCTERATAGAGVHSTRRHTRCTTHDVHAQEAAGHNAPCASQTTQRAHAVRASLYCLPARPPVPACAPTPAPAPAAAPRCGHPAHPPQSAAESC